MWLIDLEGDKNLQFGEARKGSYQQRRGKLPISPAGKANSGVQGVALSFAHLPQTWQRDDVSLKCDLRSNNQNLKQINLISSTGISVHVMLN